MSKIPRWPLLWLSVLLLAGALPPLQAGVTAGAYVLDSRAGRTLVLILPDMELATLSSTGETRLGVIALSARFLSLLDCSELQSLLPEFYTWRFIAIRKLRRWDILRADIPAARDRVRLLAGKQLRRKVGLSPNNRKGC